MDIVIATEQDVIGIMNIISECIKSMEAQGIYMWNEFYPNAETIENDIRDGSGYVIREDNRCLAYVSINNEQHPEYSQIDWSTDGSEVLVIRRLSVHPRFQGKGIARRFMDFIENYDVNNKYSCIRLDAYSENATALGLYEKLGYKRLGEIFFPFKDLPFYCYEKVLAWFLVKQE